MRNKVYAIVEGHGEAGSPSYKKQKPAVVVLIGKLLHYRGCQTLFPAPEAWGLRSWGEFFAQDYLERAIRAHKCKNDCAAVLVLLDMDDDCPGKKRPELADRLRALSDLPFSVAVVCAKREYEAWFLASLESVQNGQAYPDDPEMRRDAKGWLEAEFGYREVRDQSDYTRRLDVELAQRNSRSFRRLVHAIEELVTAAMQGEAVVTPYRLRA